MGPVRLLNTEFVMSDHTDRADRPMPATEQLDILTGPTVGREFHENLPALHPPAQATFERLTRLLGTIVPQLIVRYSSAAPDSLMVELDNGHALFHSREFDYCDDKQLLDAAKQRIANKYIADLERVQGHLAALGIQVELTFGYDRGGGP